LQAVCLALAVLVLGAGCSHKLVKVHGKVTLDGKPLDGATVTFVPDGEGGRSASGQTGTDGTFSLSTYTTGDGAQPGQYKVIIAKSAGTAPTAEPTTQDPKSMIDAMQKYDAQHKKDRGAPKSSIPPQYGDPKTTPLKCKVPPDEDPEFPLKSGGGT
jgi:hypothetical protein